MLQSLSETLLSHGRGQFSALGLLNLEGMGRPGRARAVAGRVHGAETPAELRHAPRLQKGPG